MTDLKNELGQPIGVPIEEWQSAAFPPGKPLTGQSCRLEKYDPDQHNADLYDAFARDINGANWTYLPYGPFAQFADFDKWSRETCKGSDPFFYTVIDLGSNKAIGMASYLRIDPAAGVIEVGHIHFSPLLQRSTLSTETMFLMMKQVFDDLGYRRYEWKCDALNAPSRKTAARLGFTFEGIFRQATMYKNRNRDTAWLSIIDTEWPAMRCAYESWLSATNFDEDGNQIRSLSEFR